MTERLRAGIMPGSLAKHHWRAIEHVLEKAKREIPCDLAGSQAYRFPCDAALTTNAAHGVALVILTCRNCQSGEALRGGLFKVVACQVHLDELHFNSTLLQKLIGRQLAVAPFPSAVKELRN